MKDAQTVLVGDRRLWVVLGPAQPDILMLPPSVRWQTSAVGADSAVLDSKACEASSAQ